MLPGKSWAKLKKENLAFEQKNAWSRSALNCTKFGKLILRKIIKIVATRYHILKLKCTKFDCGWSFASDPAGGAYSAPPEPLAGFKGPASKKGMGGGKGRQGRAREGRREGTYF